MCVCVCVWGGGGGGGGMHVSSAAYVPSTAPEKKMHSVEFGFSLNLS